MALPGISTATETKYPVGTVLDKNGNVDKQKTAENGNAMGKDSFMKLLVAQLKYQNPLSPTDSTQMMQQSAQFSMLEALQDMQESLTSQINAQSSSTALGMVGKTITAT